IDADAFLGGSFAKKTYLEIKDFDIFIRFNSKKYKTENISIILINFVKNYYKNYTILHGSRDYIQLIINKKLVELVPILKVNSYKDAKNITDMSPLHVKYVNDNLKNIDEVKLLKLFLKCNKLYGAESYIGGFSGYICELLIIKYKTFANLIKNVALWDEKTIIDIMNYYKNNLKLMQNKLTQSKFNSPLIFIDPVQDIRNASNALSKENYNKFIFLCNNYLNSKTKKEFFILNEFKFSNIEKLAKKSKTHLFYFKYLAKKGLEDVIGGKVKKAYNNIKKIIVNNDFTIFESGFNFNKNWSEKNNKELGYIYFLLNETELPLLKKHFGPKLFVKEAVESFKKKYNTVNIENDLIFVYKKRIITNLKQLKKTILIDKIIKNNFKKLI
ncbi:hypothetical protein HN415_06005, partial [Candidatus Woesearchaeota archaeon]|nr:hypothetical protein [Candidatus Woesearchaeota archaeon]